MFNSMAHCVWHTGWLTCTIDMQSLHGLCVCGQGFHFPSGTQACLLHIPPACPFVYLLNQPNQAHILKLGQLSGDIC